MKQGLLMLLNGRLILLIVFSCKKEKGTLDGLTPGRFDFVYVLNNNGNHDTITGELIGASIKFSFYLFKKHWFMVHEPCE